MIRFTINLLLFVFTSTDILSQDRGLQPDDYYHFQFVNDPQISPDGDRILFTNTVIADDRRTRESSIWIASTSGDFEPRAFTSGKNDRNPRWAPDGETIAFIANRNGEPKIWSISLTGGEAKPLFESEHGISGFEWSPDGSRLLLSLSKDLEEKKDNDEPQADVRIVTTALYKADRSGILPESRTHLWVYHIEKDSLQQLTWGDDWNARSASFSPDGSKVIYHANPIGGDYEGDFNADLFVIPSDSGSVTKLTTTYARSTSPVWSADGNTVAFNYTEGPFEKSWITAHQPDKFRAAVTQRSISNWISQTGTHQYVPHFMREMFGGTMWENYDYYWGRSPLKYADQVKKCRVQTGFEKRNFKHEHNYK